MAGEYDPPRVVEVVLHHGHPGDHKTPLGAKLGSDAVTASRAVLPGGDVCALLGWSVAETTGAAGANFRLWDCNGINTELLARCNLAANESNRERFGPHGIRVSTGRIFLEVLSGSVEGVLYWR